MSEWNLSYQSEDGAGLFRTLQITRFTVKIIALRDNNDSYLKSDLFVFVFAAMFSNIIIN